MSLYQRITASAPHAAAALDDRTMATWNPAPGSPDADLLEDLEVLVPRSRDLVRNNGLASGGLQTLTDSILGHVLRLAAKPNWRLLGRSQEWADEWVANVESLFRDWGETTECDAGRQMTLLGVSTQALRGAFLNGDSIGIPHWLPRPAFSRWGTRLQVIEGDRLDTPPALIREPNIRGGVEIDRLGAPVAYWIRKTHPGDVHGFRTFTSLAAIDDFVRIPAFTKWGRRRVIHLHDPERSGQSRGKPILTAIMREFRMLGHYATTELQAAVANSLVAATLESTLDQDTVGDLFGAQPEQYWRETLKEYHTQLKGGAMIPLPIGAKLNPFMPGRPNSQFDAFVTSFLRFMGAGLNLPYELFAKDFSKVNYSSARAALLEAWRYFLGRRRWFTDYWLSPIYELWLEEAINRGMVDAPDFYPNKHAYLRARWVFAGRGWVDPVKEAEGARIRMDTNVSTLEQEAAEQGLDWEEVLDQRQREREAMQARGIPETQAAAPRNRVLIEEEGDATAEEDA